MSINICYLGCLPFGLECWLTRPCFGLGTAFHARDHQEVVHYGFVQNPAWADTGGRPYSEILNRLMGHP